MAFVNIVALTITINLAIQVLVLILLCYGYHLNRGLKFRQHGIVMSVSLILHLILTAVVMVPSLILAVIKEYIIPNPLGLQSVVSLIHVVFGSVAIPFAIWIVGSWGFRKNLKGCLNRKKLMKATLVIWCISLVFGIIIYGIFIGPLLSG